MTSTQLEAAEELEAPRESRRGDLFRDITPAMALGERLKIERKLGEGGLASVHEVTDRNLRVLRALKKLHPGYAEHPVLRERLVEEARINARLDHPGILPVHELGIDHEGTVVERGALYFTMKKVEGETLAQIMGRLSPGQRTTKQLFDLLQILVKVCDALAFAHGKGVIHRDIKPANIMVGRFGEVFVMDWGVAKATFSDAEDLFAGTLCYMSPEQSREDHAATDARSDIFSLGAVLFEMLAGRPPYDESLPMPALRFQTLQGNIPDVRNVAKARIPPGLAAIAMKALSVEREDRQQSALELKAEVEEFMRNGWDFPRRTFGRGELIVVENKPGSSAFVIVEGSCRAYKTIDGQKLVLREMHEGDVFGESTVFARSLRTASVEALTDLTVVELEAEFFEMQDGAWEIVGRFVRALAERFRERDARAAELEAMMRSLTRSD